MKTWLRWGALAGVAVFLLACTSDEAASKEAFSKEFSCPPDRVTVTPRKGDAYEAVFGKDTEPTPEIKADPGRYSVWKKERQDAHDSFNNGRTMMAVKGCDHVALYHCGYGNDANGGRVMACSRTVSSPD
jgi:hypothetical protein